MSHHTLPLKEMYSSDEQPKLSPLPTSKNIRLSIRINVSLGKEDESEDRSLPHNEKIDDDEYYLDDWELVTHEELEQAHQLNENERIADEKWESLVSDQINEDSHQEQSKLHSCNTSQTLFHQEKLSTFTAMRGLGPHRTKSQDIIHEPQQQSQSPQNQNKQTIKIRKYSLHESQSSYQLLIQAIDSHVFIKIDNMVGQVSKKLIDFFTHSFIQKGIPTLVVDEKVYEEDYADKYWCLYFTYLHQLAQKQLRSTMIKFYKCKPVDNKLLGGWSFSLEPIAKYLFESYKSYYSKAKLLKTNLLCKYRIIRNMRGYLKQKSTQEIMQQLQKMLTQLAHLEVIESFERSVVFCKKQGEKDKLNQTWKALEKMTEKQMKSWICKHDIHITI